MLKPLVFVLVFSGWPFLISALLVATFFGAGFCLAVAWVIYVILFLMAWALVSAGWRGN